MNIKQHIVNGGEVMARNPDIEVEVLKTDMGGSLPILVRWKGNNEPSWRTRTYPADGAYGNNALDLIPKRPNLKVDDPVVVWYDVVRTENRRYFKEWGEDGRIVCWRLGKTKWSATDEDDCCAWNHYELPEEFEKVIL
jgi:hypothetical protein